MMFLFLHILFKTWYVQSFYLPLCSSSVAHILVSHCAFDLHFCNAGFLSLITTDISDHIILCTWGCPVHCRKLSCIPSLYSLHVRSIVHPWRDSQRSLGCRGKTDPLETRLYWPMTPHIFSCAYLPSTYFLWQSVFWNLSSSFKIGLSALLSCESS